MSLLPLAAQPGDEPGIDNLAVGAGKQGPIARSDAGDAQHEPAGGVAAAGKFPPARQPVAPVHGMGGGLADVQGTGYENVGAGAEDFFLGCQGPVTRQPGVGGPQAVTPGGGGAAPAQLGGGVQGQPVGRVQTAETPGRPNAVEARRQQVGHRLRGDAPQFLGSGGPFLQDGYQGRHPRQQFRGGRRIRVHVRRNLHGLTPPFRRISPRGGKAHYTSRREAAPPLMAQVAENATTSHDNIIPERHPAIFLAVELCTAATTLRFSHIGRRHFQKYRAPPGINRPLRGKARQGRRWSNDFPEILLRHTLLQ